MSDTIPTGLPQLDYYCGRIGQAACEQGFVCSSAEPRGTGNTHEFLRKIQAELTVGGNFTRIVYHLVYCPIADRTYVDARHEGDIKMTDFNRFEEFVQKSKALDALVERLLPEKQIIFS